MLQKCEEFGYLREGGYVFNVVCLFVSRITQKLVNRFPPDLVERWHMGRGRNH